MRLGYACINMKLREDNIFCSRSTTLKTLTTLGVRKGVAHLRGLALANVADLLTILKWNEAHGIRVFRITSNLFPHMGNHKLGTAWRRTSYWRGDISFAVEPLREAGQYALRYGHRLTFHMSPFIQLGAVDADVLSRSIFDIKQYLYIYEALRVPADGRCLILHGGGVYQTDDMTKEEAKSTTLRRWLVAFETLPTAVQHMIVLENDERHYGVSDLLPLCESRHIPLCFDYFHNDISEDGVDVTPTLLRRIARTWGRRRPKFHLSEQDRSLGFGAHAAMVHRIPDELLKFRNVDIMIEAKNKEIALTALHRRYFTKHVDRDGRIEWRLK